VGDWLGTGTVANFNKQYRSFKEAREFSRTLNLKGTKEWNEYCKSGEKPDDIPAAANEIYKKDFKGFGDWLGTGTVAPQDRAFLPYKDAREFARALNLKGAKEWFEYCASDNKPEDIPTSPNTTYKKDFKGMGDWLGTGTVAPKDRVFLSFKDAREFVRALNLKSQKEWFEYLASDNKPEDIPTSPNTTYKKDFKGFGDWLGTGTVAPKDRVYRPFKDAREFVRALNLKGIKEWKDYCNSGNKPDDIPSHPWTVYKEWNIKRRAEKK
jgi:hypothetical protein